VGNVADSVREIDAILKAKDEVREYLIRLTREIIRDSSTVITYVHLGKLNEAEDLINKLANVVRGLDDRLKEHPELRFSNLLYNALAEYVEALQLLHVVKYRELMPYNSINIHYIPYLQGVLDLVGELKRYILGCIRRNELAEAWNYFNIANEIYEAVRVLNYPDALLPGIRHKVDVTRRVLEDLRVLLVDIESRSKLISMLGRFH